MKEGGDGLEVIALEVVEIFEEVLDDMERGVETLEEEDPLEKLCEDSRVGVFEQERLKLTVSSSETSSFSE